VTAGAGAAIVCNLQLREERREEKSRHSNPHQPPR